MVLSNGSYGGLGEASVDGSHAEGGAHVWVELYEVVEEAEPELSNARNVEKTRKRQRKNRVFPPPPEDDYDKFFAPKIRSTNKFMKKRGLRVLKIDLKKSPGEAVWKANQFHDPLYCSNEVGKPGGAHHEEADQHRDIYPLSGSSVFAETVFKAELDAPFHSDADVGKGGERKTVAVGRAAGGGPTKQETVEQTKKWLDTHLPSTIRTRPQTFYSFDEREFREKTSENCCESRLRAAKTRFRTWQAEKLKAKILCWIDEEGGDSDDGGKQRLAEGLRAVEESFSRIGGATSDGDFERLTVNEDEEDDREEALLRQLISEKMPDHDSLKALLLKDVSDKHSLSEQDKIAQRCGFAVDVELLNCLTQAVRRK